MAAKTQTKKVALQEPEEEKVYIGESETSLPKNDDNLTQFKDEVDDYYKKKNAKKIVLKVAIGALAAFCLVIGIGAIYNATNNKYKFDEGKITIEGDSFLFKDNNSFTLDGVEYSMPLKASSLLENGWTIIFNHEDDKVDYIEGYNSAYVIFQKDGKEFEVTLKSYSGEKVAIENADVYAIYIDDTRTPNFLGPLDLSIGEGMADVVQKIEDSGYSYECSYYNSKYSSSRYYSLVDRDNDDYYYSCHVDCVGDELDSLSIYYNDYTRY